MLSILSFAFMSLCNIKALSNGILLVNNRKTASGEVL